ncbi:hypothetical protein B9G55_01675 [Saccharibacillus sp. O16]|nr:hypothetical protein B9G55_01675 [Saccharibacillus sp. O16]
MNHHRQVRVIRSYTTAYPEPIILQKGECVAVGEEDTQYPGWIRCMHPQGRSGWVPVNRLVREEQGERAIVLEDYSAHELTVEPEEELTVLEEESGWLRCMRQSGEIGWLPRDHVEQER